MRRLSMLVAVLLAACGQTGALYLPDAGIETPVVIRPAAEGAPGAAGQTEDETDEAGGAEPRP